MKFNNKHFSLDVVKHTKHTCKCTLYSYHPVTIIKYFVTSLNEHIHSIRGSILFTDTEYSERDIITKKIKQ